MTKNKFCHRCLFWEKIISSGKITSLKGLCKSEDVRLDIAIDKADELGNDNSLWTSEYFGCIHWRENTTTLFDIGDTLKEQEIDD